MKIKICFFLIFIILLIFILFHLLHSSLKFKEQFIDYCIINEKGNKECKNQVNYLPIAFPIPCSTQEECDNDIKNGIHYWCSIRDKCYEKVGTEDASEISKNVCGTDILNNQILFPYASKEECIRTIDPCEKYNENKDDCLKDVKCGYCTNKEINKGKCISGTASGPNDLEKYYFCTPNQKNSINNYEYGNHALYIL